MYTYIYIYIFFFFLQLIYFILGFAGFLLQRLAFSGCSERSGGVVAGVGRLYSSCDFPASLVLEHGLRSCDSQALGTWPSVVVVHGFGCFTGFPGGSDSKESACNSGDLGSIPGLGSPGGGHSNPLQYSCLENSNGQRSLVGYCPWGCKESDTTERLNTQHTVACGIFPDKGLNPCPLYWQADSYPLHHQESLHVSF